MKFTKKEFKELLLTIMAGSWVRSSVAEMKGKDHKEAEKREEYFAEMALKLGYEERAEEFQGKIIPSNDVCLESEQEIEEYNEGVFWFELETSLGRRDFFKEATKKEMKDFLLLISSNKLHDPNNF